MVIVTFRDGYVTVNCVSVDVAMADVSKRADTMPTILFGSLSTRVLEASGFQLTIPSYEQASQGYPTDLSMLDQTYQSP